MFLKFVKILFFKEKKYFFFVFFAVLLSLFSYLLWNNVVSWVKNYLQEETKPILWADIVISHDSDFDIDFLDDYIGYFEEAKTIEIDSTIFDKQKPFLYEFVYYSEKYPFYGSLDYDNISKTGSILVDQKTYDIFWDYIKIFDDNFLVKWIIKDSPLTEISIYSNNNKIYIPLNKFNSNLNKNNSRLDYKYYLNFKWDYSSEIALKVKDLSENNNYRATLLTDRQDSIWEITDRFYLFINFFNLIIFLLTFFIVILSLESFFKKNKSNFWLLNIFWLTKTRIFLFLFLSLSLLFLIAFLFSVFLNYLILYFLNSSFSFIVFDYDSFLKWIYITIVLLLVGIFLPFYKIFKSNISWLINDNSDFSNFWYIDYIAYLFLIFLWFFLINFISWISILFSLIYSFVIVFLVLIFYIFITFILKLFYKNFFSKIKNFYIFDSVRSTVKPWNVSFLIIFSSIISFISIFVFFVFSWSFLNYLNNITSDSNDMFVLNAWKTDLPVIEEYLEKDEIYEIINLRINSINNTDLKDYLWVEEVSREFSREFFSTTKDLDVAIVEGSELISWYVSVDREFWDRLWVEIWDIIEFDVAWLTKKLEIINFREAVRSWTNPFFFFQLHKSDFENYPKNYILSYKQSEKQDDLAQVLSLKTNSSLSFIDTKEIIDIVINVANQILKVVYFALFYVFLFSIISFLVSLFFLKKFKESKIYLLNILWWKFSNLIIWLKFEYFYLIIIWLFFSIIFWSITLFFIFSFIDYFGISLYYYFAWIILLLSLFLVLTLLIYFVLKIKKDSKY